MNCRITFVAEINRLNCMIRIFQFILIILLFLSASPSWGADKRQEQFSVSWVEPSVQSPTVLVRKEFVTKRDVKIGKATLYVASQGLHEAWLNGKRVGDEWFAPGWTEYNHRLQYRQYDVTGLLNGSGTNALGLVLANGWYRSRMSRVKGKWAYGDRLRLSAFLVLSFRDGAQQVVNTDETWKCHAGEITKTDIYDGECCDARLRQLGWSEISFDDAPWSLVAHVEAPAAKLIASESAPVRIVKELKPVRLLVTPKGEHVLDFGQNITGWVRCSLQGCKGDTVSLRFAETLDKDGNFYTRNLRTAKATDTYVFGHDGKEEHHPRFTFFGFRYVKVEGTRKTLRKSDFVAQVLSSDLRYTGTFECSDPMVNKLVENTRWSMMDNFLDIPTDCPQRDERLGWTADAQVFAPAACYLANARSFFAKWLEDVRLSQAGDGGVACVVPDLRRSYGSSGWDDVVTVLPTILYKVYGDTATLRRMYPSMEKWVGYCVRKAGKSLVYPGGRFGDWFDFSVANGNKESATAKDMVGTAYLAYSAHLTAEAAKVLGLYADGQKYDSIYNKAKETFQDRYIFGGNRLTSDTQTAYVLALAFHLIDANREAAFASRLAELVRERGHITTGFLGTPLICKVLTDYGYEDEAYRLLTRKEYPSWLYSIDKGATTIWERWDAIKPDGTLSGHSLNHYAFGAVVAWLFGDVAGIAQTETSLGFQHLLIQPRLTEQLKWAKASYLSSYGWVKTSWKSTGRQFKLQVEIPQGVDATVVLPYPDAQGNKMMKVGSGKHSFKIAKKTK